MKRKLLDTKRIVEYSLAKIEKIGNKLPNPITLFALFALGVIILSWVVSQFDFSVILPGTGKEIKPVSLLSVEGLHKILIHVLLVPLSAMIFLAVGRHPIAGLAAAFAGVSGGYSANLLLGTIDPLLAGLTQEAAHIIDKSYEVNAAANYYFLFVSTFFIATVGTWVTEKLIIPRLGEYKGTVKADEIKSLSKAEKTGLWYAAITVLSFILIIAAGLIPENGFLRETGTGNILRSPFLKGIVAFIFFGGFAAGLAYGIGAKTIRSDNDIWKGMSKSIETLGSYIVLVFFAAQFVAFFNWTNLGQIFAVEGAQCYSRVLRFRTSIPLGTGISL